MRPLRSLLLVLFFLVLAGSAGATQITISQHTIPGWVNVNTSPRLRIYVNKAVVTSTSTSLQPGSAQQGTGFYQSFTCSVAGGILTIPQLTLDSLTNALVGADAKYSAWFYTATGQQIGAFSGLSSFTVPASPVSTTWPAILVYNSTNVPHIDNLTYNRTQINAMFASTITASAPVVTTVPDAILTGEFALSSLADGLLKHTAGTPARAIPGTDFEPGLTFSAPLARAVNTISMPAATSGQNGYLSSSDWTTFNSKQAGDADLTAIGALGSTGFAVRTGAATWAQRSIAVGSNLSIINADGSAGNPTVSLGTAVPTSVVNDTNVTGSIATNVLTIGWTGTLGKARTLGTTVYTDQVNTFGAFTQTFQGNAVFSAFPVLAGFAVASLPGGATTNSLAITTDGYKNLWIKGVRWFPLVRTISGSSRGMVCDNSTDDSAALQLAVTEGIAAGGAIIDLPEGVCLLSGALQSGSNSIIKFPARALSLPGISITFRGTVPPAVLSNAATMPVSGTILRATTAGGGSVPSVIGVELSGAGLGTSFSNYTINFENLTVRTTDNPTLWGLNLRFAERTNLTNVTVDTGVVPSSNTPATNGTSGIILPEISNDVFLNLTNVCVAGYAIGIEASEHVDFDAYLIHNLIGVQFNTSNYPSVGHIVSYQQPRPLKFAGASIFNGTLAIEDAGSGTWNQVTGIEDGSSLGRGTIHFLHSITGSGNVAGLAVTGAANLSLHDLFSGNVGIGPKVTAPLHITKAAVTNFGQFTIQDTVASGSNATTIQTFYDSGNTKIGLMGFMGSADPQFYFQNLQAALSGFRMLSTSPVVLTLKNNNGGATNLYLDATAGQNTNFSYQAGALSKWFIGNDATNDAFRVLNSDANGNARLFQIQQTGNVAVGNAALAQSASNGFFYLPTITAGVPNGTPTTVATGLAPIVIDTTNSRLYGYFGSAWVNLTGGGANTALSNLASVAVNTSLLPASTQSLGSASFPWLSTFVGNTTQYSTVSQSAGLITHAAAGSATNIGYQFTPKGTGQIVASWNSSVAQWLQVVNSNNTALARLLISSDTANFYLSVFGSNHATPALRNAASFAAGQEMNIIAGAEVANKKITFYTDGGTTPAMILNSTGTMTIFSLTNATLGTPANGTIVYCSDCTIASPCAGSGTGALAKRLNGVWVCN